MRAKTSKWPATANANANANTSADVSVDGFGSADLPWVAPAPFISRVSQVAGRRPQAAGLSQPTANVETIRCYSWEDDGNQCLGRDVIRCASGFHVGRGLDRPRF